MSDWIVTYTGRRVNPLAMRPEDIDIQDIAHALAIVNRFTGHTRVPYSVAEHSIRVSWLCTTLRGLLHDAPEAYLADIARPVKHSPEFAAYRAAEERLMAVICQKFGMPIPEPVAVKWADRVLCTAEIRDLTRLDIAHHGYPMEYREDADRLISPINPWDWETAKFRFLDRFAWLNLRG